MKHEATRDLFAYWDALRGERAAPERSEIDPTAIRHILADTFMLDVDVAARFPFRLAGTRVNGLFDAEQKGCSFLDLWRPEERRNVAALLMTVTDGASPVVAGGSGAPIGEEPCRFEVLLLPLRHFGKTHSRILGMITPADRHDWLGLLPLGPLALRSLRVVDRALVRSTPRQPGIAASVPLTRSTFGLPTGTPPAPVILSPAFAERGKPHLRLIDGGRPSP